MDLKFPRLCALERKVQKELSRPFGMRPWAPSLDSCRVQDGEIKEEIWPLEQSGFWKRLFQKGGGLYTFQMSKFH